MHFLRLLMLLALCLTAPLTVHAQSQTKLTPVQELWVNSFQAEREKDYDLAVENVARIIELTGDATNTYANLRLGRLCYLNQDYARARTAYAVAAKSAPGAVSPLLGLINCDRAEDKTDSAIARAKQLLDIDPMNFRANRTLGELYYRKADFESAAIYYYKLVVSYPEDLEMANRLAWCYLKLGHRDRAKSIFSNILAVQPSNEAANLGYLETTKETRNSSDP